MSWYEKKWGGVFVTPPSGNLLTTTQTSHDPHDLWIMIHRTKTGSCATHNYYSPNKGMLCASRVSRVMWHNFSRWSRPIGMKKLQVQAHELTLFTRHKQRFIHTHVMRSPPGIAKLSEVFMNKRVMIKLNNFLWRGSLRIGSYTQARFFFALPIYIVIHNYINQPTMRIMKMNGGGRSRRRSSLKMIVANQQGDCAE